MDTKENNPGADRREVVTTPDKINLGGSILVTNFDSYSTTQTLPVVTTDVDGAVVNYSIEARSGDIIWSAPGKDPFYYGVPLKPEYWQYQAVNEVGGAFVNNFVSGIKHNVFLVFSLSLS